MRDMTGIKGIGSFCRTLPDFSLSEGLVANSFAVIANPHWVDNLLHLN
jgi:hypothetical protein